jgi:membrane fusion protein, peptide pheromone/bacteriocin exporter
MIINYNEYCYITHLHKNNSKSQIIYIITLVAVVLIAIFLPIIKINVSIQGTGIIRPVSEKTEVKIPYSEMVEKIFIKENQFVIKGSRLIQLNTRNLDAKLQFLNYQKQENENYLFDLDIITKKTHPIITVFRSLIYKQEYLQYLQQIAELQNKKEKANKEYLRNKQLFENQVIPEKDFDDFHFQYITAQNEYKINIDNQLSKWQIDLSRYQELLSEIKSNITQLLKEKDYYTLKAPVSGTIEQFAGIFEGSHLQAGQTVAIISPDSSLISEIYINPKDIGYISLSNQVRIQVDAFNYNEWGIIKGTVAEISSDFILLNNIPMFKVRCNMNKTWLKLNNNIRGNLKKGMTIRARFLLTKRSLFQLLYKGIDDWINPTQY